MFDQPTPNPPTGKSPFVPKPEEKPVEDIFEPVNKDREELPVKKPAAFRLGATGPVPSNLPRPSNQNDKAQGASTEPVTRPKSGLKPELKMPESQPAAEEKIKTPPPFSKKPKDKKFVIIGLISLIVIGGAIGGWVAYHKFFRSNESLSPNTSNTSNTSNTPNANINKAVKQTPTPTPSEPAVAPPSSPQDSDGDGLTDEEELKLGTDPENSDTDNDGLFDREEVKVYKTDPLNADTDGDGYLDGEEVNHNYDPKGPGKLKEIK